MRTALLAFDYPPSASGLAVAAREIAESLLEAGVPVSVFTLDRVGRSQENGVTLVGCRPAREGAGAILRRRAALGHLVAPAWFRRAVMAEHRAAPFALVEATNWYAPGALLALSRDLPLVTRASTPAQGTGAVSGPFRDRLDGRFACALEAFSARAGAGLIANTAEHGAAIERLYRLPPTMPRTVIGLSLPPERLARAANAPYPGGADGPIRLLFVGRPEARKGFDLLLEAGALLCAEAERGGPDLRLTLVGIAPGDVAAAPPALRERLALPGRLDDAALDAAYRDCHLVVAPSRYESFGLVYQEALAFGRPVVGLALDASARAFVGEPGAGALAPEPTAAALADALRPLLANGALRADLHERARAASGRFTRASLGRETKAFYERVLAERRPGVSRTGRQA
ncbi:glycosyltransferase family 4 protein [Aurantimonas sp. Leaf443]|uniref:glycosyltransferase family 4 protein n=1 Tax=Aurantimonas sp. Leaf443 TaxID=1736378 RepID=UPI0006FAD643|nr:glycosyltransferase family 4 protein [Aurantimonas sp. Leaf443]KQT87539.1 glycosyl transferase family 1 [Aurantimonas sp. Leaf443]